jgi:phage regulator Rha-like protein
MGVELDGANQKVVLDNDSDTYLQASTDDTLDIYIAGAKDFAITANTLTAESGSTIVLLLILMIE